MIFLKRLLNRAQSQNDLPSKLVTLRHTHYERKKEMALVKVIRIVLQTYVQSVVCFLRYLNALIANPAYLFDFGILRYWISKMA